MRTQQLIAYETGVPNVIDPLGGSWYVESLTNKLEKMANNYFDFINTNGGVISCIESGFFQKEIADSSEMYQKQLDSKKRVIVGVNKFIKDDEVVDIPILKIDDKVYKDQVEKLRKLKNERDNIAVQKSLNTLMQKCKSGDNIMESIIAAAKSYATLGEIVETMKEIYGEWQEKTVI